MTRVNYIFCSSPSKIKNLATIFLKYDWQSFSHSEMIKYVEIVSAAAQLSNFKNSIF